MLVGDTFLKKIYYDRSVGYLRSFNKIEFRFFPVKKNKQKRTPAVCFATVRWTCLLVYEIKSDKYVF